MSRRLIVGLAAAAVLGAAAPEPDARLPNEAANGVAVQEELSVLAGRLRDAWTRQDARSLASWFAPEGISLNLGGAGHPALGSRQARTAIADFLGAAGPGTARTVRAEVVDGGTSTKGLVELAWTPRPGTVPAPAAYGVFVGLERRAEGWRATEIRVIR